MKLTLACVLALICFGSTLWADVVTLKNGDRITGTLISITGGTLQLKSDMLGAVSIPMDNVSSFSAAKPVAVIIKGQEPVQGTLEFTPSRNWQVTANGKVQTIAAATVNTIMPDEDYQKLVAATPKLWQAWEGNASLGYSIQSGNQRTTNLVTSIAASRERPALPIFTPHFRTDFSFTTLLSHAEEDGSTVTSRVLTANLTENYLLTPDNFLFVLGQVNHVSTQNLYLQQTYGGGYGRYLVKNARTTFNITVGPTFVQEKFFNGDLTQTAELLVGETLGEQLSKKLRLDHYLQVYPDLINTGQYRFNTSTVLSLKLTNRFSVNASVLDLFLSNPPAGSQKNNITFSTGIGYSF